MTDNFTEDSGIGQIAMACASEAVDFARDNFKLVLDWSDDSVAHVETMLGVFHDQLAEADPGEEKVFGIARLFGSYVGEVFRRNHGATWGIVELGGETFPGLRAASSSWLFWPWARAQNRIRNGPEDNIQHYYQLLLQKQGDNSTPPRPDSPAQKKSWWRRLRGD